MGLSVLRFRMASKKATAEAKKDWAEFLPLVERFNAVAVYERSARRHRPLQR